MNSQLSRYLALALLASIAACSGKKEETEAAASGAPDQTTRAASPSVASQAQTKDLGKFVDLIVAEAADLPRAEFDPAALAKQLGKDPAAQFNWVRDHTSWAPYRGLLRGSQGVLLDRVGSNLDRAVLLGDLLRHAGHTVRLAHAELAEVRARELLARIRPIPDQRLSPAAPRPLEPDRMRQYESIMPGYVAAHEQRVAATKRSEDTARSLVHSNESLLQAAIREMTPDAAKSDDRAALDALRDYWWVERKDGDDWVAMDVLPSDARPGDAPTRATAVSFWKADSSAPEIPATDWHTVTVRVVVERYENGATTESNVLEKALHPAAVLDRPIRLRHLPKHWPEDLLKPGADPNALGNAAVNVREWVPFLEVGDQVIAQSGFTDSGDLIANPMSRERDIAGAGGAGFMSGFGEALGGGEAPASSLTAEWVDYEIQVPGESAQIIRRPVFDLLGPVLRSSKTEGFDATTNDRLIARSEALLSQTDIFLQPCELTVDFVTHLVSAGIVANREALKALAAERDSAKAKDAAAALFPKIDVWNPLLDMAQWRSALGNHPTQWFIDRPNVLAYRITPPVVNAERTAIVESIDIASNPIGVRARGNREAFQVRVRQGVADTVAEFVASGRDARRTENTASFISLAMEANAGTLVRLRDTTAVHDLHWPDDATARIAADLESGYAVVGLERPFEVDGQVRTGWWRIDPATGETVGVMDNGFHPAMTEREMSDFQLNYMMTYRHLYSPSVQTAVAREIARREFMEFGVPIVGLVAAHVVGFVALALWGD